MIFNGFNHFKSSVESALNSESHCNSPISVLSSAMNLQKENEHQLRKERVDTFCRDLQFSFTSSKLCCFGFWHTDAAGVEKKLAGHDERRGKERWGGGGGGGGGGLVAQAASLLQACRIRTFQQSLRVKIGLKICQ